MRFDDLRHISVTLRRIKFMILTTNLNFTREQEGKKQTQLLDRPLFMDKRQEILLMMW